MDEARRILALPPEIALRRVAERIEILHTLQERCKNLERMLTCEREKDAFAIPVAGSWAGINDPTEFTETPGVYPEDTKMPVYEVEEKLKDLKKARITSSYFPPATPAPHPAASQSAGDQTETSSASWLWEEPRIAVGIPGASPADTRSGQTGTASASSGTCTRRSDHTTPAPDTESTEVPPGRERFWVEDTSSPLPERS